LSRSPKMLRVPIATQRVFGTLTVGAGRSHWMQLMHIGYQTGRKKGGG
jgi:hypothetical protein